MTEQIDVTPVVELVEQAALIFTPDARPEAVLEWAAAQFGPERFAVAASFSDTVLAHIAARAVPGVDVVFVDTGYHFAETRGLRDAVAELYDITVRTAAPAQTVAEQDATYGEALYARDPDLCCRLRKVEPFDRALSEYSAWASGLRRDDHAGRQDVQLVAVDTRRGLLKVNPLAFWTQADVDAYVEEHGLLQNPLRQLGYRSIGCAPCTRPVEQGEQDRSGRWTGFSKAECGIHS